MYHIVKKNAKAYKYNYTDLAEITKLLDRNGIDYYQYVEPHENGSDYIITAIKTPDGKGERHVMGCKIIEPRAGQTDNPAQFYGAALTYARRYSLLMAFGLATTDDDAASLRQSKPATIKEIQQYEATCGRRNIDPQAKYAEVCKTTSNYKNMTGAQLGYLLRTINDEGAKK